MPTVLKWDRTASHLPWIRVRTSRYEANVAYPLHSHDFAEWYWLESGSIVSLGQGLRESLTAGDMRFLRPGQEHALAGAGRAGVLIIVSIPGALFLDLERRYGGLPAWPWHRQRIGTASLSDRGRALLSRLILEVPDRGQDICDADWFVASMLRVLRQKRTPGSVPGWLAQAVDAMNDQRSLACGLPMLVEKSGRSPAHLSRTVRRAYGCTAIELIQRLRCEHAARELRMSIRPIVRIANDVGYGHLGNFYRRFAELFGCTPRRYRLAAVHPEIM